jgi:prevent-host-death family protein
MAGRKTINLYEAKTHLSELVERAAAGEEIVIAKRGTPKARLVPLRGSKEVRKPGGWEGKIWVSEDFDDPLPPEILAGFLGEEPDDGQ